MEREAQKLTHELIETLQQLQKAAEILLQKAAEKEAALLADDIGALRNILELEEDAVHEFEQLEKQRMSKTSGLLALLGNAPEGLALREIADRIDDEAAAKLLRETGAELAETVTALRDKNLALNKVLSVKSEYADLMLDVLTGNASTTSRTYTESGDLGLPPDPEPGVVEFFA